MRVGIVGLGAMGGNAARRLAQQGFDTTVFDVEPARMDDHPSTSHANSPADLAGRSDVILAFLTYSEQFEDVALGQNGIHEGAAAGSILVNMGTIAPAMVRKVSDHIRDKQVSVLGAPMNGGPHLALSGGLALVVGGAEAVLEKCRPVLAALGEIRHVGDVGAGEAVKLINNLLLAVCTVANAEALVLGVKYGVDPDKLVDAVVNGVGSNHAMRKHYQQHVLAGDFQEGLFSVDYMRKDLALALELGDELKVPLPFAALADQSYQAVRATGKADQYHPVVVTLLEEMTNVRVRSGA